MSSWEEQFPLLPNLGQVDGNGWYAVGAYGKCSNCTDQTRQKKHQIGVLQINEETLTILPLHEINKLHD